MPDATSLLEWAEGQSEDTWQRVIEEGPTAGGAEASASSTERRGTMPRTILVHLNVEVPDDDRRLPHVIASAIYAAIEVGSDDDSVRDLKIRIPLVELVDA